MKQRICQFCSNFALDTLCVLIVLIFAFLCTYLVTQRVAASLLQLLISAIVFAYILGSLGVSLSHNDSIHLPSPRIAFIMSGPG